MHDDAGRLRRRRILVLLRQRGKPEGPALVSTPTDEVVSADEDYLMACGPDSRYTVIVEDLARRVLRQQTIDGPVFQIGQGPQNDLWLKHERIQSHHLLLVRLPEGIYFVTLSPEAEVIGPKGPLTSGWWTQGLILRAGAFRLRLTGAKKQIPAEDPLAVSALLDRELPRLELRFQGSAKPKRKAWAITRTLTLIGRCAACKICLDHDDMLPVEAALVRTARRLWLINLGESERVLVNDAPILSASVDVGDRVSFGEFRFEVQASEDWPIEMPATALVPSTPATTPPTRLDQLVQECAAQHQKILAAQQQALKQLEMLAGHAADPAQLKPLLEKILKSNEALGSEQARLQETLRQTRPANSKSET